MTQATPPTGEQAHNRTSNLPDIQCARSDVGRAAANETDMGIAAK